jgi:hypothetical protein
MKEKFKYTLTINYDPANHSKLLELFTFGPDINVFIII